MNRFMKINRKVIHWKRSEWISRKNILGGKWQRLLMIIDGDGDGGYDSDYDRNVDTDGHEW